MPCASRPALTRGLADLSDATLAVLHVADVLLASAALADRMKLSAEDVRGLVVEGRRGAAAAVIVREAAERHTALIVMCTHTRLDGTPRTFGTVAEAVLRTTPCPVVLVPPVRGRRPWAAAELVVLHVATPGAERPTEAGTLVSPRYVDQPHHEWPAWAREFLDRVHGCGPAADGVKIRLALVHGSRARPSSISRTRTRAT